MAKKKEEVKEPSKVEVTLINMFCHMAGMNDPMMQWLTMPLQTRWNEEVLLACNGKFLENTKEKKFYFFPPAFAIKNKGDKKPEIFELMQRLGWVWVKDEDKGPWMAFMWYIPLTIWNGRFGLDAIMNSLAFSALTLNGDQIAEEPHGFTGGEGHEAIDAWSSVVKVFKKDAGLTIENMLKTHPKDTMDYVLPEGLPDHFAIPVLKKKDKVISLK